MTTTVWSDSRWPEDWHLPASLFFLTAFPYCYPPGQVYAIAAWSQKLSVSFMACSLALALFALWLIALTTGWTPSLITCSSCLQVPINLLNLDDSVQISTSALDVLPIFQSAYVAVKVERPREPCASSCMWGLKGYSKANYPSPWFTASRSDKR